MKRILYRNPIYVKLSVLLPLLPPGEEGGVSLKTRRGIFLLFQGLPAPLSLPADGRGDRGDRGEGLEAAA
jgi:hypothetical protein